MARPLNMYATAILYSFNLSKIMQLERLNQACTDFNRYIFIEKSYLLIMLLCTYEKG